MAKLTILFYYQTAPNTKQSITIQTCSLNNSKHLVTKHLGTSLQSKGMAAIPKIFFILSGSKPMLVMRMLARDVVEWFSRRKKWRLVVEFITQPASIVKFAEKLSIILLRLNARYSKQICANQDSKLVSV